MLESKVMTRADVADLAYDFRYLALFCSSELVISYADELSVLNQVSVGHEGLGAISRTVFTRSLMACRCCGNCCRDTKRQAWYWYDFEFDIAKLAAHGIDDATPVQINVNNVPVNLIRWRSVPDRCRYLDNLNHCYMHVAGVKTWHCSITTPGIIITRSGIDTLSVQHRGRNWRWPQCPVTWSLTEYDEATKNRWLWALGLWRDVLSCVPGSKMDILYPKLVKLFNKAEFVHTSVLYLADLL